MAPRAARFQKLHHGFRSSGFAPGGLGWYRKTFTLAKSMTGKRISLEFDGVYEDSVIYVNGQQVGTTRTATPASPSTSPCT